MTAVAYPRVRSPIDIGALRLPHRIVTGSMHLNLETADDGRLAAFYAERARGGAGLIVTGGAAVSRVGAGGRGYALINEPEHWDRWRRVAEAVHAEGGLIALQLFHAGRYAQPDAFGLTPLAPSAVYSRFSGCEPEAMSGEQIERTIADFASGAMAAFELGFDAVEVMASEGYLLNQFVSPVTNLRDDEWGGDAVRRRAFPLAVVSAIRRSAGSVPVLVRISGADLVPGSSTQDEVDALAVALAEAGADAIDVGIGWHESRVPTVQSLVPHGVWAGVAGRIRDALRRAGHATPVIASNRINSVAQAERILGTGQADLVSMARPFLADPAILAKSFSGREQLVNTCIGCNEACIDRSFGEEPVSCLVNPRAGRELEFPMRSSRSRPRAAASVAVIGAGPAGMEAARSLAEGGVRVTLFESAPRIGGQFLMAGMVPGKADFLETVRYFERELARLGVRMALGAAVTTAVTVEGFDHVVVATGVRPRPVSIPGAGLPLVVDYQRAFAELPAAGSRVAVIGAGGIGVDLAHLLAAGGPDPDPAEQHRSFLAAHGLGAGEPPEPVRAVTIMRRSGSIGAGMGVTTRWAVVQDIRRCGVETLTDVEYREITPAGVLIRHGGDERLIGADTVVLAAGQEPNTGVAELLERADVPHTVIGGALRASGTNAVVAFEQGLRCGAALAGKLTAAQA